MLSAQESEKNNGSSCFKTSHGGGGEQELCMHLMNALLSPFEYRDHSWTVLKPRHEGLFFAITLG